jgi:hypothetical protein
MALFLMIGYAWAAAMFLFFFVDQGSVDAKPGF